MLFSNKTKQKEEENCSGGSQVWLNPTAPWNWGALLNKSGVFSGGTPAFPVPAALQEHKPTVRRDLLPTPTWKLLKMELETAFTVFNLFLSVLNSCKTSLRLRRGSLKCPTCNHTKNQLHSKQQRCFHSIWCLSSPKFSPWSLPLSIELVQTPRFGGVGYVPVFFSCNLVSSWRTK